MARFFLLMVVSVVFVIALVISSNNQIWNQLKSDKSLDSFLPPAQPLVEEGDSVKQNQILAKIAPDAFQSAVERSAINATRSTVPPEVLNKSNNNVPHYARDELMQPHVDGKTYISDRLRNLTQTIRIIPRESFLPASSGQDHAVFYNVYVPKDNENGVFRLIINNQMRGVYASRWGSATVYYNLIGQNTTRQICRPGQTCHSLRYMSSGGEVDTLQDMYEYCVDRPRDTVVYLHDKGSFHFNPSNSRIRRLATKAALTDECYNLTSDQCNVCSVNFNFAHFHHTSGNMFSAKCSYIRTLIPPKEFEIKRLEMLQHVQENTTLRFDCFRECVMEGKHTEVEYHKHLAIGRYSYETWVYSSPLANPCFVLRKPFSELENGWEPWDANLTYGNEFHISHLFGVDKLDYYQGQGKLFEYRYLYGKVPGNESWFWPTWNRYLNQLRKENCEC